MLKHNVLFATAIALSLSSGVAIAVPADGNVGTSRASSPMLLAQKGGEDALIDKLDLTDEQKQTIQSIRTGYRSQMESKRTAMQQAHEAMKNLMQDSNTTRSQLESQHNTVSALRQDLANLHFQQMMDIRDELTPAQRAEVRQHMGQKKSQGWGNRPENGAMPR